MESKLVRWGFKNEKEGSVSNRTLIEKIRGNLKKNDVREIINLGNGDPTPFPSFKTTPVAEEALLNALHSSSFNGYPPPSGVSAARRAVADHLSEELPYKLLEEDVFITSGASQAIEAILTVLARPRANILLPRPGFPLYKARAALAGLEVRHFDLLPDKGWEVDLPGVEAQADDNTIAMLVINPGYPTGNVFTVEHMQKIAESARRKGMIVIADEVYRHIVFGGAEFMPMGMFGSLAPVLTVGSLSKRWLIPGWRLGWIAASDPNGLLNKSRITEGIQKYFCITSSPATLIQVKLNLCMLEGIEDELDFCCKLAEEESVILLPGIALGLKNWVRVTFAVEPSHVEDAFRRIKAFYQRHANNTN